MKRSFAALRSRDYQLLWWSFLFSRIGSEMQIVAIIWHVYILTHSSISLGMIGLARLVPLIVTMPFAGIVSDVFNRKKIIFITQVLQMAFSALLCLLTLSHHISAPLIYLYLVINSAISTFEVPARQSLIPHLVPKDHLVNAFSLHVLLRVIAQLLGPALSGFLIAIIGVGDIYLINTLTFIATIIAVLFISYTHSTSAQKPEIKLGLFFDGFKFAVRKKLIISTMLLDFFATLFGTATVLMPIFANEILHVGPQGLGFLYAAPSLGGVIAGLLVAGLKHERNTGKLLFVVVMTYALATILFGISRSFAFSLACLTIMGAGDMVSTVLRNAIRQLSTPDEIRGRVTSIGMFFASSGPQLGEIEAGVAASLFGTQLSVVLGGIGTILSTFAVAAFMPIVIRYTSRDLE